jgi:hypothetical protein
MHVIATGHPGQLNGPHFSFHPNAIADHERRLSVHSPAALQMTTPDKEKQDKI